LEIFITEVTCRRCGKTWPPRIPSPRVCPGCHSAWWDIERGDGRKLKQAKSPIIESESIRKESSIKSNPPIQQYPQHERQPVYQPPVQPHYEQPLSKPPKLPDGIQPIDEFYPGQHPDRIQKGREAISTMISDLVDPKNTSINPDKDMGYPIRKCKKCGFVGYPPQISAHKCS
jgi:predicted Zn-ribbon and HTH transcriptional regulator